MDKDESNEKYDELLQVVVDNDARGLERAMICDLNFESCRFYHRCHKASIASVLQQQDMLRELPFPLEQKATFICMQLQQYSHFAAHWARILAEGDEKVAMSIHGISTTTTNRTATTTRDAGTESPRSVVSEPLSFTQSELEQQMEGFQTLKI